MPGDLNSFGWPRLPNIVIWLVTVWIVLLFISTTRSLAKSDGATSEGLQVSKYSTSVPNSISYRIDEHHSWETARQIVQAIKDIQQEVEDVTGDDQTGLVVKETVSKVLKSAITEVNKLAEFEESRKYDFVKKVINKLRALVTEILDKAKNSNRKPSLYLGKELSSKLSSISTLISSSLRFVGRKPRSRSANTAAQDDVHDGSSELLRYLLLPDREPARYYSDIDSITKRLIAYSGYRGHSCSENLEYEIKSELLPDIISNVTMTLYELTNYLNTTDFGESRGAMRSIGKEADVLNIVSSICSIVESMFNSLSSDKSKKQPVNHHRNKNDTDGDALSRVALSNTVDGVNSASRLGYTLLDSAKNSGFMSWVKKTIMPQIQQDNQDNFEGAEQLRSLLVNVAKSYERYAFAIKEKLSSDESLGIRDKYEIAREALKALPEIVRHISHQYTVGMGPSRKRTFLYAMPKLVERVVSLSDRRILSSLARKSARGRNQMINGKSQSVREFNAGELNRKNHQDAIGVGIFNRHPIPYDAFENSQYGVRNDYSNRRPMYNIDRPYGNNPTRETIESTLKPLNRGARTPNIRNLIETNEEQVAVQNPSRSPRPIFFGPRGESDEKFDLSMRANDAAADLLDKSTRNLVYNSTLAAHSDPIDMIENRENRHQLEEERRTSEESNKELDKLIESMISRSEN